MCSGALQKEEEHLTLCHKLLAQCPALHLYPAWTYFPSTTVITVEVWSCAQGYHTLIITIRDRKARNNVIRACLTGLSAKLNDFEYLQHHLAHSSSCLSSTYRALSVLVCGPSQGHTAGVPELFQEFSSFKIVKDGRSVRRPCGTSRSQPLGYWLLRLRRVITAWPVTLTLTLARSSLWLLHGGALCLIHFILLNMMYSVTATVPFSNTWCTCFSLFHIILGWKPLDVFWAFVIILSFCRVITFTWSQLTMISRK